MTVRTSPDRVTAADQGAGGGSGADSAERAARTHRGKPWRRPRPHALDGDLIVPTAKILLAVTDPFCAVFFRGQLSALAAAGAEVVLVTSPGEWAATMATEEGAEYRPVAMEREIAPLADLKAVLRLVRLLRQVRPDIVSAGTPKAALLVLAAASAARVPARVFVLHGLRSTTLTGLKGAVVRGAERLSATIATDVLCVSPSLRAEAVAQRIVEPEAARIIASGSCNGVDLERFRRAPRLIDAAQRFRESLGCGVDDVVVGYVGRLTREKGILELAEAWQLLRDGQTRLVFIGPDESGPEPAAALRLLRRDPRVHFTGALTDMPTAYAAMDLLVLPTWREGFGNVLIEAAAMALPVVASRVTGCVDAVADGETGILVPPRDPLALAEAVQQYIDRPDLRAAHGAAGRRRVEREFDSSLVWREQITFYSGLLQRSGRPSLRRPSAQPLPQPRIQA
jgi:glycosyltransferase involved in cell wall biosynthesis